jgi:predicted dehydrogenase
MGAAPNERRIGVVMNGVTGRMGLRQHLQRSVLAIRETGGIRLDDGTRIVPDPILVGRNETKLREIADAHGLTRWTTDLAEALAEPGVEVYFDAQLTQLRDKGVRTAVEAGKAVYCEKPIAEDLSASVDLARLVLDSGVVNGVVQDKLSLPGLRKLKRLVDGGFFGRIVSVRGEFGYWVFEGDWQHAQRPSWNYRREDGGGIVLDMFCHWRYVLDHLFAPVRSVYCQGATHIPVRYDEQSRAYDATADDAAYGIFELEGGIVAQLNSSWTTRVYRDELVEFHVDGTEGSAVAGLRDCKVQHRSATPKPIWNPDLPATEDFRSQWQPVPDNEVFDNAFKVQWEQYLRSVVAGTPFPYDFTEGVKGVQLAELGLQSWREGRKLEVPPLQLGGGMA